MAWSALRCSLLLDSELPLTAFNNLLASWNSISSSFSLSTLCFPSRWWEGAPSWHNCYCIFSQNYSVSFLISRHSDALWHVELCTGHFTPPSSMLDG
jgi:hypothetical protein